MNRSKGTSCNIDIFQPSTTEIFRIGPLILSCSYFQALGYLNENKSNQTKIHFGKLCCNNNKVSLPQFPDHPP